MLACQSRKARNHTLVKIKGKINPAAKEPYSFFLRSSDLILLAALVIYLLYLVLEIEHAPFDPDLYQHNLRVLWIIGASSLFVDIYQPAGILLVWNKAPPSFSCISMYLVITSTSCLKCLYCHMMAAIMLCYLFS